MLKRIKYRGKKGNTVEEKVVIELKIVVPRILLRAVHTKVQQLLNYLTRPALQEHCKYIYIVDGDVEEGYNLDVN
jgi:hypothetical protein